MRCWSSAAYFISPFEKLPRIFLNCWFALIRKPVWNTGFHTSEGSVVYSSVVDKYVRTIRRSTDHRCETHTDQIRCTHRFVQMRKKIRRGINHRCETRMDQTRYTHRSCRLCANDRQGNGLPVRNIVNQTRCTDSLCKTRTNDPPRTDQCGQTYTNDPSATDQLYGSLGKRSVGYGSVA